MATPTSHLFVAYRPLSINNCESFTQILEGQTYTLLLSDTEADRDRARASSVSRWSRRSHADLPETAIAEKLEVGDFPLTAGGDVGEGTGVAESRQPAATADPSASGEDDEENIDTMSKIMAIIHRMSDYVSSGCSSTTKVAAYRRILSFLPWACVSGAGVKL